MSRKGDPLEGPRVRRRVALLLVVSGVVSGAIAVSLAWPWASYLMKLDQAFCAGGGGLCRIGWRRAYQVVGPDVLAVAGIAFLLIVLVVAGRRWLFLAPPGLAIVAGLMLSRGEHLIPGDRPPLFFAQGAPVNYLRNVIEHFDPSWSWTAPTWMEHRLLWGAGLWFAMLLPAGVLALAGRGRARSGADRVRTFRGLGFAAATAALYAGVLLAVRALAGLPGHGYGAGVDALDRWSAPALAIWCFSYGAVLGRLRRWWPLLHALVPFLTVPVLLPLVAQTDIYWRPGEYLPDLAGVALYVPFVVIGARWESLGELVPVRFRRLMRRMEIREAPTTPL